MSWRQNADGYYPRMEVRCPNCEDRFTQEEVEFVNIEEDFEGRDVMTFICPSCLTEQKSHIYR